MKGLLGFLMNKWVIQGLGLLALALLLWFAGPVVAIAGKAPLESEGARWLAIAAMVLVWMVFHLARLALAGHKDRELIKGLAGEEPGQAAERQASAEKVERLRLGFEEAVKLLRESRAKDKSGRHHLYELPWYVIIGNPGSGKTTALVNSGLKFPLAERMGKNPVKGVSGTRDCDWWFTNEAVLLDTAGRYVTQDSHKQVDAEEWQGFLRLVKKYRPDRPLNGILVTSSLSDLLQQTEEERLQQANTLRRRVQELHQILGVRLPIYMLFTKTDLVAGFTDFFADFGQEEREQVWGETFPAGNPAHPQDGLERFGAAYDELLARLNLRTYKRIQEERDIQRRSLILGFPQQMALLKPSILGFLQALFAPNSYEQPLLLRGVYFTSGTQEGNPIDRLMGILASAFRLDRQASPLFSGQGKSFFLTRLLKNVVFPEAELAGTDPRIERRQKLLQWGSVAAALALTLGMLGLWVVSYGYNKSAIAQTDAQIARYRAVDITPTDSRSNFKLLQRKLDALREARDIWRNTGWLAHFGLYQGDTLEAGAEETYQRLLRDYFLPALANRLHERIQAKADVLLLRTYLMFGEPGKREDKVVEAVAKADWELLFNAEPDTQASLAYHLQSLLALKPGAVQLDQNLIAEVRAKLTQVPLEQQCYDSFKAEKAMDHAHDFKLADALRPNGQKAFIVSDGRDIGIATVPGLFTAWGYKEHVLAKSLLAVQACMEQNKVLDNAASPSDPREVEAFHDKFKRLYLGEYQQYWSGLLNGIKPRPAQNLQQTVELLDILSRPDSPLRQLLVAVESNTALGKVSAAAADALAQMAAKAGLQTSEQDRKLLADAREIAGRGASATGDPVRWMESSFEGLNALVRGGPDKPTLLDAPLNTVKELRNHFMQKSPPAGAAVVEQAKLEFANLPEPVRSWLLSLTGAGLSQSLSGAKGELKDKLKAAGIAAGPGSQCQTAFAGRYPFVKSSQQDAPLADFSKFFAPGGVMDQFFLANLKDLIDTGVSPWRQKPADGQSVALSPEAIRQFQSAAKIRDSFFSTGGQTPQAQFDLKLLELSPGVDSFHFNNEGQDVAYRGGTEQTARIQWPGPAPGSGVQITFETPDKRQASQRKGGPWALFRLLEESSPQRIGGQDRFILGFQAEGFTARFELRAYSVNNPFSLGESRNFHCPESL